MKCCLAHDDGLRWTVIERRSSTVIARFLLRGDAIVATRLLNEHKGVRGKWYAYRKGSSSFEIRSQKWPTKV